MFGFESYQINAILTIAAMGSIATVIVAVLGWLALDSIALARQRRAVRRFTHHTSEDFYAESSRHRRRPAASADAEYARSKR